MRVWQLIGGPHSKTLKNAKGFTLIEMLVALVLVALICVAIVESLRFGQHAYLQVNKVDAGSWELFSAQRFLRAALESAYPYQHDRFGADSAYAFQGAADRLEFTAPAPQSSANIGFDRYEIFMQPSSTDTSLSTLMVRWGVDRHRRLSAGIGVQEEALVENITGIELSYLSDDHSDQNLSRDSQWRNSWNDRQTLPQLVRIRIKFPEHIGRRWPDIVVAPRITHDANCFFDVVAQDCRKST